MGKETKLERWRKIAARNEERGIGSIEKSNKQQLFYELSTVDPKILNAYRSVEIMEKIIPLIESRLDSIEEKLDKLIEFNTKENEEVPVIDRKEGVSVSVDSMVVQDKNATETFEPSECIHCKAIDQMKRVKAVIYNESGTEILYSGVPAFECQECGEMTFTQESYRYTSQLKKQ